MAKISAVALCLAAAAAAAASASAAETPCGHSRCPENFVLLSGRCLNVTSAKHLARPLPWPEARELCQARASGDWTADLASVDVPLLAAFTDFIKKHIPDMTHYIFWAGARKVGGEWQELDGTPIDPLDYMWHMQHPSDASPDDYAYGMLVPASTNQLRFYLTPYSLHSVGPSALCEARRRA
ncbi:uncharacterized protein LOC119599429 [Penaeus monodon]|uniref:uncharacterized protein LOC119599429 n=1 Tax=Penaeus monodon TaxID=6687 RepID=UPI0018A7594C|nr:uncharacterized protein LOC119599429 [Penaeus monodon]